MRVLLIVEDDPTLNKLIAEMLTDEGYSCMGAFSGEHGFLLLQRHQPDLVLLDLNLPVLRGEEFLLRKHSIPTLRNIPVIVISGLSQPPMLDGVVATLVKPFSVDDFLDLVRRFAPMETPEVA